ncbi:CopG family transcriptional regulator [Shewanella phaeophyticola]|uniref:CopG family transcriptional regulator n=1 Tax=Shewanella phaeophyticola TaxID=2978345 RepID=A0ABT2P7U6_9GAMM|nr:CopG family transcriptional regulator [Shewanella sp. KJ10-1]MCT8987311.1 CopG family transcriptional regulator [Shewanella sp. KJ10-1]
MLQLKVITSGKQNCPFYCINESAKKQAFEQLCAAQDLTPSQVTRQLIREYLEKHDVSFGDNQSRPNPQVKS